MRGGGIAASAVTVLAASLCLLGTPSLPPASPAPPREPSVRSPSSPYDTIRAALDDYAWPTDAGRIVTSTFGEYRRTHFHAGIDISTGDQTGYRVLSSRAGYVSRIRVLADGYGKMLFVRHPDGYTTTYSHLSRFADRIERLVRAEQLRLQRYPVDLPCAPADVPVAKGEVIGYTGETGTGSAHLHFELRDENMNGVNPQLSPRLRHPDNISPRFLRLAALPSGPGSRVQGREGPFIARARQVGPRTFRIPQPIRISGAAGLAVFVRDFSDGSRFANGVYRHRLFLDGNLAFEVRLDRLPIAEGQQIAFAYASGLLRSGEGRFEKLFVDGRHTLPIYSDPAPGAGILTSGRISAGAHRFAVISQDFSGNSAELTGTLILDPPASGSTSPGVPSVAEGGDPAGVVRVVPGTRGEFRYDGGALTLAFDSLAVYDTTTIHIRVDGDEKGRFYALSPAGGVLREGFTVTIRLPGKDPRQGIFHRAGSRWTLLPTVARDGDRSLTSRMRRWIGDLRVARDELPPVISPPRFYPYGRKGPVALFRFADDLAGVDYQSLATYIDSTFVVPDIDGEHRRATVSAPEGLTRGSHRLTIRLSDQLGNTSFLERRFVVP